MSRDGTRRHDDAARIRRTVMPPGFGDSPRKSVPRTLLDAVADETERVTPPGTPPADGFLAAAEDPGETSEPVTLAGAQVRGPEEPGGASPDPGSSTGRTAGGEDVGTISALAGGRVLTRSLGERPARHGEARFPHDAAGADRLGGRRHPRLPRGTAGPGRRRLGVDGTRRQLPREGRFGCRAPGRGHGLPGEPRDLAVRRRPGRGGRRRHDGVALRDRRAPGSGAGAPGSGRLLIRSVTGAVPWSTGGGG